MSCRAIASLLTLYRQLQILLIEGKTYPCYVNPEHITFVERKNQMTYIHLVSGEVIESVSPVEKVVSLLSQR